MVARDAPPPEHIQPDAIIEALLEIRFNAPTILPEVLFGRLAEHSAWKDYQQRRMPAYELPAAMREADLNLRYAPILELVSSSANRMVRIGPHVFSYHCTVSYPGWGDFRSELITAIDEFFQKATDLTITRLGMRYVNALRPELHGIDSIRGLDLEVRVSQDSQPENMNLNFLSEDSAESRCMVRVAAVGKEFVMGPVPPDSKVVVDVDVFSKDDFSTTDVAVVKQWVENAHLRIKQEFFHLLKPETIARLKRD